MKTVTLMKAVSYATKRGEHMIRNKNGRRVRLVVFFCLGLVFIAFSADAQQIGYWTGSLPQNSTPYYKDFSMTVPQDGSVTVSTTVASTFISQFCATEIRDQNLEVIDYSMFTASPSIKTYRLAAGTYTVRIARPAPGNFYGAFTIMATLAVANAGATEVENNDLIADASTHPDHLFAGAIGHIRTKTTQDLYDYYRFSLVEDTDVNLGITSDSTILDINNTGLSLRNGSDVKMDEITIWKTSTSWDLHLAAGIYFLKFSTFRAGGYTIVTTKTPAMPTSSETEKNDTIGTADTVQSRKLYGSIGYYRDKIAGVEDWDNDDYFSCQVGANGTLTVEIFPSTGLQWANNSISIRNASNTSLASGTLGVSSRKISVSSLSAGTYYIRVFRGKGSGGYRIEISGDVTLPPETGSASVVIAPLAGGILNYVDGQGNTTSVKVPSGAVTLATTLSFTKVATVTPPSGMASAQHAFTLEASQGGSPVPNLVFAQPVTVTVQYSDADVVGMNEGFLILAYWNGSAWVDAATSCTPTSVYDRHPADNWLAVPICHLSQFALFGVQSGSRVYLPLILRD
jgi:hypothetical protein